MEKKIVGHTLADLDKLTPDGLTTVVIPGPITREFGNLSFQQASEIINQNENKYYSILNELIAEINRQINNTAITYRVGYSLMLDINIKIGGFSHSQLVRSKLEQLKLDVEMYDQEEDDLPYVEIGKCYASSTERSLISRLSKKIGLSVKTEDHGVKWLVKYKPGNSGHPKSTSDNKSRDIQFWLSTLTPLTPTKPPAEIVKACTDSYFRTVLNKSPYHCSYRRGAVTIYPAKIIDDTLYLGTNALAPVSDPSDLEYLDMILAPYGHTHSSVVNA